MYGREVYSDSNREGPAEREGDSSMAWREETKCSNEGGRGKIKAEPVVGFKEAISRGWFLGIDRSTSRRQTTEGNGRYKEIYKGREGIFSRDDMSSVTGINKPPVRREYKQEVVEASDQRSRAEILSWSSSNWQERLP